jgi:hypothetical protein
VRRSPDDSRMQRHLTPVTAIFAALILVGALAVLMMNSSWLLPGPTDDSIQYLTAAESFVDGDGFRVPFSSWASASDTAPLRHYPPGFSAAIGGVMTLTGVRSDVAALWILAVSGGLSLGLTFLIGYWTGGMVSGFLAAGLVALLPSFSTLHIGVWSEPLFLALTLATVALLVRWPDRRMVPVILAALSLAVRYVGFANVALVVVWGLGRDREESRLKRWVNGVASMVPALLFLLFWARSSESGGGTVRSLGSYWHLGSPLGGIQTLPAEWLVGGPPFYSAPTWQSWAGLTILGALAWLTWRIWPASEMRRERRLWWVTATYFPLYAATIIGSRLVLDPDIPMEQRIWFPALLLLTIAFGVALPRVLERFRPRQAVVLGGILLLWVGALAYRGAQEMAESATDGRYYSHVDWRDSGFAAWAREVAPSLGTVYSNRPEVLHFFSGTHPKQLVRAGEDESAWEKAYEIRPGPIVLVDPAKLSDPDIGRMMQRLGLRVAARGNRFLVLQGPPSDTMPATPAELPASN